MAEIRISCPQCGGGISVAEKSSGAVVACPRCAARITVSSAGGMHRGQKAGLQWECRSERTIATAVTSRHSGGPVDGERPLFITQTPEEKTLMASVAFRGETQANGSEAKTYRVQGCLPVLLICVGAFVSLCDTGVSDYTTRPTGALLAIAGIVWAIVARRISAWRGRRSRAASQPSQPIAGKPGSG